MAPVHHRIGWLILTVDLICLGGPVLFVLWEFSRTVFAVSGATLAWLAVSLTFGVILTACAPHLIKHGLSMFNLLNTLQAFLFFGVWAEAGIGYVFGPDAAFLAFFAALLSASAIFLLLRCPSCKTLLMFGFARRRSRDRKVCPECGVDLRAPLNSHQS